MVKQLKIGKGNSFTKLDFHVDVVVDVDKLSQIFEFVKWWNINNSALEGGLIEDKSETAK